MGRINKYSGGVDARRRTAKKYLLGRICRGVALVNRHRSAGGWALSAYPAPFRIAQVDDAKLCAESEAAVARFRYRAAG